MPDKIIIFDMDGVLIDSEPAYEEMNKKLFHDLGIRMDDSGYKNLVGMSSFKMWSMLKENFNLKHEVEELIILEKNRMFEILNSDKIKEPVKGIKELIGEFKKKNYTLCVASSSAKENIELVLNKHGLQKYFDYVVSGEEVKHGKPAPDIFLNAAKKFNANVSDCFVIEDSANGLTASKAAGMKCIGFKNNGTNPQNLNNADIIVDNFDVENTNLILEFIHSN